MATISTSIFNGSGCPASAPHLGQTLKQAVGAFLQPAWTRSEQRQAQLLPARQRLSSIQYKSKRILSTVTWPSEDDLCPKKVNFLWSYVNDLVEQNQVLVETVEDLQKEADDKVSCRGMKLPASDPILNAKLTDQYAGLVGCCVDMQTGRHSGPCPGQCCMDKQLPEMEEGRGGVPWKTMQERREEEGGVQGTVNQQHSVSLVQITSQLEDLKIQLQTKDMVICDLERMLRENSQQKQKAQTAAQTLESRERLELLQRELSCLQRIHKDNMKEITERGVCITKLQAASELLRRQEGNDTRTQMCQPLTALK
ncbi:hypothetical protein F7725_028588 [Dissostichus mawsoni]|uniref:Uncharacterized protein n=1 Tax=Dissostichus mawsoni TaxID=36200 RepID=A0A7J5XGE3_DISMA|nr:hypothetical protein F7725_028588 [Dissostichus mawsoni]